MSGNEWQAVVYGARGSLPNPTRDVRRFGGATTCMLIETPDGPPVVIDAGSGIFDLGRRLVTREDENREAHLLFTHTHWDHVQGLPFFAPLFDRRWTVHIHALAARTGSIRNIFAPIYSEKYFPVPFDELQAKVVFHDLKFEDELDLSHLSIRCCQVNHPGYALGFRVERAGQALFFASDAAPFEDILFGDHFHRREREQRPPVLKEMARFEALVAETAKGVDVLFHDANYSDEEYGALYHFGHASLSYAYALGEQAGAAYTVFWHHDRARRDDEVKALSAPYVARGQARGVVVEPARQGAVYAFAGQPGRVIRSHLSPAALVGSD